MGNFTYSFLSDYNCITNRTVLSFGFTILCTCWSYCLVNNLSVRKFTNPLLAFVCRIVRNISIDRHRMNAAMKRDTTYDVAMSEIEYCVADPVSVEDRIEAKVLARLIENFLDTLSEENRVIFMRRYWFSDSYADIAAQTGLSEKNVSVRLTRTRKQLREYLIQKEVLV